MQMSNMLNEIQDEYMEISWLEVWKDMEDGEHQKSSLWRFRDKETKQVIY